MGNGQQRQELGPHSEVSPRWLAGSVCSLVSVPPINELYQRQFPRWSYHPWVNSRQKTLGSLHKNLTFIWEWKTFTWLKCVSSLYPPCTKKQSKLNGLVALTKQLFAHKWHWRFLFISSNHNGKIRPWNRAGWYGSTKIHHRQFCQGLLKMHAFQFFSKLCSVGPERTLLSIKGRDAQGRTLTKKYPALPTALLDFPAQQNVTYWGSGVGQDSEWFVPTAVCLYSKSLHLKLDRQNNMGRDWRVTCLS